MSGTRMPAETDPHERTLVAWPTERRRAFWEGHVAEARDAWAELVRSLAPHEPVTVAVDLGELQGASARLGSEPNVELVEVALDDCWIRDTGPVVVSGDVGSRHAVQFGFNAWGGLVEPWDRDATLATRLADHLGLAVSTAPFVLEGGAVAVDGHGLVVTTERCLLHSNRGLLPGGEPRTPAALEALLVEWLGAEQVVWLRDGLADDTDTDGHVDNVVALPRPGTALLQGCDDPGDPDAATAADNRSRLVAAGLDVVELPVLPRTERFGRIVEVPYANLYAANGVVVVPVTGHPADADALDVIADCYPGREVQPIDGSTFAFGGGGPHCATQQVPAA